MNEPSLTGDAVTSGRWELTTALGVYLDGERLPVSAEAVSRGLLAYRAGTARERVRTVDSRVIPDELARAIVRAERELMGARPVFTGWREAA